MNVPIRAICTRPVALGLALAGVQPTEVADGAGAAAAIEQLASAPAAGPVILIERSLLDDLPAGLERRIHRAGTPILVPFPGPALDRKDVPTPEDEILEILRRAVGYRLRLR